MSVLIEALVCTPDEAIRATRAGANRIELCVRPELGGVSPPMELVERVLADTDLPVMCMVRPRGGDFVYSWSEKRQMLREVERFGEAGITGVVFGALRQNGSFDVAFMKALLAAAGELETTVHRAFDETLQPGEALEELISLSFRRVLTSGQAPSAVQGIELLRALVEQADGRICIMAGAGLTDSNYAAVVEQTGITEVHGSWWARVS